MWCTQPASDYHSLRWYCALYLNCTFIHNNVHVYHLGYIILQYILYVLVQHIHSYISNNVSWKSAAVTTVLYFLVCFAAKNNISHNLCFFFFLLLFLQSHNNIRNEEYYEYYTWNTWYIIGLYSQWKSLQFSVFMFSLMNKWTNNIKFFMRTILPWLLYVIFLWFSQTYHIILLFVCYIICLLLMQQEEKGGGRWW